MATIKDYQRAYNDAKARGDSRGMADAHANADRIRGYETRSVSDGRGGYSQERVSQLSSSTSSGGSSSSGGRASGPVAATVRVGSDGRAPSGLNIGQVVETAGGNYRITGYNNDGSYKQERVTSTASSDVNQYKGQLMTFSTRDGQVTKKFEDMSQGEKSIFLRQVGYGAGSQKAGVGYAYIDEYGMSHVSDDIATARAYSKDGNIYEYTGAFAGGYAVDAKGNRKYLDLSGSVGYGNTPRDAQGNSLEGYESGKGLKNISNPNASATGTTMVDGKVVAKPQATNGQMSSIDLNEIKDLQAKYRVAKTDQEKIALNAQANAIRDKYGIAHEGSGVSEEVRNSLTSAISSSLGTTPEALATPETSALIDQLAAIAANKRDMTINDINANEQAAISEQNSLTSGVNTDYNEEQKQLNDAQYASAEQMKSSAINRGIGNSQQIVGLEQGISNKYAGMRFTSSENREVRLNAIKDKIAVIKQQADAAIANADLQYSNDLLTAQAEQAKAQQDYQLKASLQNMQNAFTSSENAKDRDAKIAMFNASFEQDLAKMGLEQSQKKELMGLEQTYKVALSNMEYRQRASLARSSSDANTIKYGLAIEAAKSKLGNEITPEKLQASVSETLSSAVSALSNKDAAKQMYKYGVIPGVSALELQQYKKTTGNDLLTDLKKLTKVKEIKNPENKVYQGQSQLEYTLPSQNAVLFMKKFDTQYFNKTQEVQKKIEGLSYNQLLYGDSKIPMSQAEQYIEALLK